MEPIKIRGHLLKRRDYEQPILAGGYLKIQPKTIDIDAALISHSAAYLAGRELSITIDIDEKYTDAMRALFHVLVRKIKNEGAAQFWDLMGRAPESFEEVKDWCKIEMSDGMVEPHRVGEYMHIPSFTTLNKKTVGHLIDNMLQYCMEMGVSVDSEKAEYDRWH
jgi:hypothetical protein